MEESISQRGSLRCLAKSAMRVFIASAITLFDIA
jgi:hypothetical protein